MATSHSNSFCAVLAVFDPQAAEFARRMYFVTRLMALRPESRRALDEALSFATAHERFSFSDYQMEKFRRMSCAAVPAQSAVTCNPPEELHALSDAALYWAIEIMRRPRREPAAEAWFPCPEAQRVPIVWH